MKTTYKYLLLAGLVVLAASCEKEIEKESPADATTGKMITETISAQIEGETKATVDADAKFAWSLGDNIAVHVTKGDSHLYVDTVSGASEEAASASFSVSYGEGFSRDAFAIFPSTIVAGNAANYGQSGSPLDVTLPASYSLSTVTGEKTRCPMIASNTSSSWTFSQLCGLLRLTVNSIPSDATGLIIQFPGKKVNGTFSIAYPVTPGSSTIVTDTPASGEDQITVTFAAGTTSATINLPLPTGDYDDVFITPVGSSTKVAAVRHINAGGYTAQAAHGKKLTTTMVSFSMAADKKVVFAPGNLQYIGSAATPYWKFANNQYDYFGTTTAQESDAANVDRDLFGWGTSGWNNTSADATWIYYQPWSTSYATGVDVNNGTGYGPSYALSDKDITDSNANGDWGIYNDIKNANGSVKLYDKGTWKTPTKDYWYYIYVTRTCSSTGIPDVPNACWIKGTIAGQAGMILFPDNYAHPGDASVTYSKSAFNKGNYSYTYFVVDAENWSKMEAAGAVFLPAAGYRNTGNLDRVGERGFYWSSTTKDKDDAWRSSYNADNNDPNASNWRYHGYSVRLIREL